MDSFVHENIDGTNGRYRWTRYLNIRVIEDTTNGYINATKMCAMYGKTKGGQAKQFRQWKAYNQHFIDFVSTCVGIPTDELIPCAVTGGQVEIIRGTYVHRDLAVKLASWCSDEFGYKVSKIINSQIESENRMLSREKDSLLRRIDEMMKQTSIVVEEITNVRKQNDEMKSEISNVRNQNDEMKSEITNVTKQNDEMKSQNNDIKNQNNGLQSTLNKVLHTVTNIEDQVVYNAEDPKVKELMVLMYSAEKD